MKRFKTIILFLALFPVWFIAPSYAEEMSIEGAYRAVPHNRTPYDMKRSAANAAEAKYLDHLFFVTDLALRERVLMLSALRSGKGHKYIAQYNEEIGQMLATFGLAKAPTKPLKAIEATITQAIRDQQQFFNAWAKALGTPEGDRLARNYTQHSLVQSSHRKLLQAYAMLKQAYPRESQHNQQAFFDHLCALDFI